MTIALLDGDLIAFRCSVAVQDDFGDGEMVADPRRAIQTVDEVVRKWTDKAGCKTPVLCLSPLDRWTFRKEINPHYKDSRGERPIVYDDVIRYMEASYRTVRIPGLEADDVMGIIATSERFQTPPVVVTTDKDLMTVPCRLFRPDKMNRPKNIKPAEADRWWMYQTLKGDVVDGYSGAPGVGDVKAKEILASPHRLIRNERRLSKGKNKGQVKVTWDVGDTCSVWESVVAYYAKAGLTEDDAILNARMARILRRSDYDKENEEITLWHPKTPTTLKLRTLTGTPAAASTSTTSSKRRSSTSRKGTSSSTSSGRPTKDSA